MSAIQNFLRELIKGDSIAQNHELRAFNIPDEILLIIFEQADQTALLALRQTSKFLASKVDALSEENKLLRAIQNQFKLIVQRKKLPLVRSGNIFHFLMKGKRIKMEHSLLITSDTVFYRN